VKSAQRAGYIAAVGKELTGLVEGPLDVGAAIASVSDGAAGAVAVFLGTTRAETQPDGRALIALDYEAYPAMAGAQLRDLAEGARARWPVLRVAVLHRTGRVAVGEPSVLVAVATPHRSEAFEACRWLIDTLKAEATIWKQEVWSDGRTSWVTGTRPPSPGTP
jgi:molybdopterin synthase catalytic subunit